MSVTFTPTENNNEFNLKFNEVDVATLELKNIDVGNVITNAYKIQSGTNLRLGQSEKVIIKQTFNNCILYNVNGFFIEIFVPNNYKKRQLNIITQENSRKKVKKQFRDWLNSDNTRIKQLNELKSSSSSQKVKNIVEAILHYANDTNLKTIINECNVSKKTIYKYVKLLCDNEENPILIFNEVIKKGSVRQQFIDWLKLNEKECQKLKQKNEQPNCSNIFKALISYKNGTHLNNIEKNLRIPRKMLIKTVKKCILHNTIEEEYNPLRLEIKTPLIESEFIPSHDFFSPFGDNILNLLLDPIDFNKIW